MNFLKQIRVQKSDNKWIGLSQISDDKWEKSGVTLKLTENNVYITSTKEKVKRIQFSWENNHDDKAVYIGDTFERNYGDAQFQTINPEKRYHWYFLCMENEKITGYGVKVNANSLCSWTVNRQSIDLWVDIRNGTQGIDLSQRVLKACSVIIHAYDQEDFFSAHQKLCLTLADKKKLDDPTTFFGSNDWNYSYGNNDQNLIIKQAKLMNELTKESQVIPWVVIDDGWQIDHSNTYNGGPWSEANSKFKSMPNTIEKIKAEKCKAGVWFRPLLTKDKVNTDLILKNDVEGSVILDPSHPKVLEMIASDVSRFVKWGFELIKFDFTTVDIFGKFGNQMNGDYFENECVFYDQTLTTCEIIKKLYQTIIDAGNGIDFISCNTISHLSANKFSIMRIGDDTSGKYFQRTRKYGVNSLAFRSAQHRIFYNVDGDCLGIRDEIPWGKNKKWLDLITFCGTPLFISVNPDELKTKVVNYLKKSLLELERNNSYVAKPLDFYCNMYPEKWRRGADNMEIKWFDDPREFYTYF